MVSVLVVLVFLPIHKSNSKTFSQQHPSFLKTKKNQNFDATVTPLQPLLVMLLLLMTIIMEQWEMKKTKLFLSYDHKEAKQRDYIIPLNTSTIGHFTREENQKRLIFQRHLIWSLWCKKSMFHRRTVDDPIQSTTTTTVCGCLLSR